MSTREGMPLFTISGGEFVISEGDSVILWEEARLRNLRGSDFEICSWPTLKVPSFPDFAFAETLYSSGVSNWVQIGFLVQIRIAKKMAKTITAFGDN